LFSNTARAHELGRTNDWVVIYCDRGDSDGQWTIVTSRAGVLRGRRVVRGREPECERYYGIGPEPRAVTGSGRLPTCPTEQAPRRPRGPDPGDCRPGLPAPRPPRSEPSLSTQSSASGALRVGRCSYMD
jgi:hypothetical protein